MRQELVKKYNLELETVEIKNVKFDVYFSYHPDFGFCVESVEDITSTQDLRELLDSWVIDEIQKELEDLYRRRGWL